MTACIVSGNTFPIRDRLKQWGGRWDQTRKCWHFDRLTALQVGELRGTLGVVIFERPTDPPPWLINDAFDDPPAVEPIRRGDDMTYCGYFAGEEPLAYFGFSSLRAMADYVDALPRPLNRGGRCDVGWLESPKQTEYTGTPTLAEAVRLARYGWSDGLGITDKLDAPRARSKQRLRTVAGGTVSVGRMLAGNPAHMIRRGRMPGNRAVTLFVETVMWQGITTWNAMLRAWIIGAMVDRLESEGYRCEIFAVYCARQRQTLQPIQLCTRLKDAGERLSIADISFALGHPAFGRRLMYAIEGAEPVCNITREVRGIIGEAFNHEKQPARNEFYIGQLHSFHQHNLDDSDPFDMLQYIEPDGLPVSLRDR